jgi:hypothetical protein
MPVNFCTQYIIRQMLDAVCLTPNIVCQTPNIVCRCRTSYVIRRTSYVIRRALHVICHACTPYDVHRMSHAIHVRHMTCIVCHTPYIVRHRRTSYTVHVHMCAVPRVQAHIYVRYIDLQHEAVIN